MADCPIGCTCGRHSSFHPTCPIGCNCARHTNHATTCFPCPPGCDCGKHFQFKGEDSHNWRGDDVSIAAGRKRAQRLFKLGPCSKCGAEPSQRHHKDKDPLNNNPDNIEILCPKCHLDADGTACKPGCRCSRHVGYVCPPDCQCGRHGNRANDSEEVRAFKNADALKKREARKRAREAEFVNT